MRHEMEWTLPWEHGCIVCDFWQSRSILLSSQDRKYILSKHRVQGVGAVVFKVVVMLWG